MGDFSYGVVLGALVFLVIWIMSEVLKKFKGGGIVRD
jgi:hypothetical protein